MNKIFYVSDDEKVEFLMYKPKSVRKKAKKRVSSLEVSLLKEQTGFLFNEIKEDGYLKSILRVLDIEVEKWSEEQKFQVLSFLCQHSNFLFQAGDESNPQDALKAFKAKAEYKDLYDEKAHELVCTDQYKRKIRKFYHHIDEYQLKLKLFDLYRRRGVKELDRSHTFREIPIEVAAEIYNKIIKCYYVFYDLLKSNRFSMETPCNMTFPKEVESVAPYPEEPTIDKKYRQIIEHCCSDEWLLPVAPILLTRFAQYCVMGHKKFKSAVLLFRDSNTFALKDDFKSISERGTLQVDKSLTAATHFLCNEIRNVLNEHLSKYFVTNVSFAAKSKVIDEDDIEYDSMEEPVQKLFSDSALAQQYWNQTINWNLHSYKPFAVPICDIEVFAVFVAAQFSLSVHELKEFVEIVQKSIFERKDIRNQHQNSNLKDKVPGDVLTSLKALLSPDIYFKSTNEDDLKADVMEKMKPLLKHRVVELNQSEGDRTFEQTWDSLLSFIRLTDLTNVALYMSKAVNADADAIDLAPKFIRDCMKTLKRRIKPYQSHEAILALLGLNETDSKADLKLDKAMHPELYMEYHLLKQRIYRRMTWEMAREFIDNQVIKIGEVKKGKRRASQAKALKELLNQDLSELKLDCEEDKTDLYVAFSYTMEQSFIALRSEVMHQLIELSNCLVKEEPKQGDSL